MIITSILAVICLVLIVFSGIGSSGAIEGAAGFIGLCVLGTGYEVIHQLKRSNDLQARVVKYYEPKE
jgi:hypothetical protein